MEILEYSVYCRIFIAHPRCKRFAYITKGEFLELQKKKKG